MDAFLRKHKLLTDFTVTLPLGREEFVKRLKRVVDPGNVGSLFSGFTEAWEADQREFIGEVGPQGFRLRRRQGFFQSNTPLALATGTLTETEGQLVIQTEIRAQTTWAIFGFAIATVIYLVLFSVLGYGYYVGKIGSELYFIFPFVLLHAAFIYLLPYWLLRRNVATTRHDLERELFWLTKRKEKGAAAGAIKEGKEQGKIGG